MDIAWKERLVHHTQGDSEEEDEDAVGFDLFNSGNNNNGDDGMQTLKFTFGPHELQVRGHDDIQTSTGLAVWLGAEVLCEYLAASVTTTTTDCCFDSSSLEQKSCLELGAGLGLASMLAQRMGAKRVVATDGDTNVLENLRFNVAMEQQTNIQSTKRTEIETPQLIWGRDLEAFAERYADQDGCFDVIFASDCVYMTTSLRPLWETVRRLLRPTSGIFYFVNVSSSQSPLEEILEVAKEKGFTWTNPPDSPSVYIVRLVR